MLVWNNKHLLILMVNRSSVVICRMALYTMEIIIIIMMMMMIMIIIIN